MSVHDLCCIGYITQDKIVTTKNTIYMPGGTSFYFAHAIKHLNPNGFLLFYEIPAYSALQIVDATGCGDTYMVGYLYMRNKGASYQEAGCFAAAMCTIKLQTHGPFCGTEPEIKRIINLV